MKSKLILINMIVNLKTQFHMIRLVKLWFKLNKKSMNLPKTLSLQTKINNLNRNYLHLQPKKENHPFVNFKNHK